MTVYRKFCGFMEMRVLDSFPVAPLKCSDPSFSSRSKVQLIMVVKSRRQLLVISYLQPGTQRDEPTLLLSSPSPFLHTPGSPTQGIVPRTVKIGLHASK